MLKLFMGFFFLLIITIDSCFNPNYGEGGFACNKGVCPEGYSCVFEEGNAICRKLIGTGEQHLDFQLSDIPMAIDKRVGDRKTSDVFFSDGGKLDRLQSDSFSCISGMTQPCYSGSPTTQNVGECKEGTQTCINGRWGQCIGEILPQKEICDGKDNDCNKAEDDQLTQSCYTGPVGTEGIGACKAGIQTCHAGNFNSCQNEIVPQLEICDGIDNDCDKQVDEELVQKCYTGPLETRNVGECKDGNKICVNGKWGSCNAQVLPVDDVCDGKDNNCDGTIDTPSCTCLPGTEESCGTDIGECIVGTQSCRDDGKGYSACNGIGAKPEKCDNLDNNCDGFTDENLSQPCYTSSLATRNVGVCQDGVQTCSFGQWGNCIGQILPSDEICDGKDNDCDKQVDEGDLCQGGICCAGICCMIPHANESCSNNTCIMNSCLSEYANCDNSTVNGCETNLAAVTENCSNAKSLDPGVCADMYGGLLCLSQVKATGPTLSAFGSRWVKIEVTECNDGCITDLKFGATLSMPCEVDYELYLYRSCGQLVASATGPASCIENSTSKTRSRSVNWTIFDTFGYDDSQFFWIYIKYLSGSTCSKWTLNTQGGSI